MLSISSLLFGSLDNFYGEIWHQEGASSSGAWCCSLKGDGGETERYDEEIVEIDYFVDGWYS